MIFEKILVLSRSLAVPITFFFFNRYKEPQVSKVTLYSFWRDSQDSPVTAYNCVLEPVGQAKVKDKTVTIITISPWQTKVIAHHSARKEFVHFGAGMQPAADHQVDHSPLLSSMGSFLGKRVTLN